MRKMRKQGILACVLVIAMAFSTAFAFAGTTVSRYTGSTYTHSSRFDNRILANGIDVSAYQEKIDWQAAKADGVDFAIIRIGYRGYGAAGNMQPDKCFVSHIQGAKAAGIMVGVYFFSQALNTLEARAEARYALELLGSYDLDLPIFMDYEFSTVSSGRFTSGTISKLQATENAQAFCDYIRESGYESGVYANLNFLNKTVDGSLLSQEYPIWAAQYNKSCDYTSAYDFWQYSSGGSVSGISSRTDVNVWYIDPVPASTSYYSMVDAQASISGSNDYTYQNGQAFTPQVTVYHGGRLLTEGVDYKVRYIGNTQAGTAYAMIIGTGMYTDYKLVPFTIRPSSSISGITVAKPADVTYTGKEVKPSSLTVKDASGRTLRNGLDYTWSVSNAVEAGTATVTVQLIGNYTGRLTTSYQIKKAGQKITIGGKRNETLLTDGPFSLNVSLSASGAKVTYTSSNPEVASVSADGIVTPHKAGQTTITVKAAAGTDYDAASESFVLKVKGAAQTVTTAYTRYTRKVGGKGFNLKAKTDGDGALSYVSDDESIAVIDRNGQVELTGGAGTVHFTVTAAETEYYGEGQKIVTLTVSAIPEKTREEELAERLGALRLKARSAKTAAGSIKVTLEISAGDVASIEELGYTVKYKFYRSLKPSTAYQAKLVKDSPAYVNTSGKKGTRYYYKARVMIYDEDGSLAAYSKLTQCNYAARIWTK